jgi:hypothetical protein
MFLFQRRLVIRHRSLIKPSSIDIRLFPIANKVPFYCIKIDKVSKFAYHWADAFSIFPQEGTREDIMATFIT